MKVALFLVAAGFLCMNDARGQSKDASHPSASQTTQATPARAILTTLRECVLTCNALRLLLNQMRNNLAFVQTSQTPLKHQFELEADAWQVIIVTRWTDG